MNAPRGLTQCIADRCPMPGTIGYGPGRSICRAHDGLPEHQWADVTTKVLARFDALQVALDGTNSAYRIWVGDAFERVFRGYGDAFLVVNGETQRAYSARMVRQLVAQCRPPTP